MTEAVIVYKPVHWFVEQSNGLVLYDNGLRHEKVKKDKHIFYQFFFSYLKSEESIK